MVTNRDAPLTREEIAQREIGHTDVGRGTVWFLLAFFLVAIAAVPAYELAATRGHGADAAWGHLTRVPAEILVRAADENETAWRRLLAANRIVVQALVAFENALEDDSRLAQRLRPPIQLVLTRWLGAGNERAYAGRDGWLFYRPDVEYVTGPPFLSPAHLERRIAMVDQWTTPPQPDPRKAIVAFHRDLAARGITLVVVPTPVKPAIHPERLSRRHADTALPLENTSYGALIDELRRGGVLVFDAARTLADAARASGTPQYLATDTHWRPEAMEEVAGALVAFVRSHVTLPEGAAGYRLEPRDVQQLGDIGVMLDLPEGQTIFPQESVTIRRVLGPDGAVWRPARDADVLVLGDSFSNIYSLASMGWGDGAGLVEHVSYLLQRPVDRIVQNDDGAYATREMLRRAGDARLAGKRVVIYQFAERELMFGDWKVY